MDLARKALDVFLHLDRHLNTPGGDLGGWLYGLLFLVIFCETGLIVTPFLPGDSLLFAVGALATRPGAPISLPLVSVLLCVAAVLGDAVNYGAGSIPRGRPPRSRLTVPRRLRMMSARAHSSVG